MRRGLYNNRYSTGTGILYLVQYLVVLESSSLFHVLHTSTMVLVPGTCSTLIGRFNQWFNLKILVSRCVAGCWLLRHKLSKLSSDDQDPRPSPSQYVHPETARLFSCGCTKLCGP
jgi:hypothetical protein